MKVHLETTLPKEEVDTANRMLRRKTPVKDAGPEEVLATHNFQFGSGFEVNICLCNGSGPYVDAALFHQGQRVQTLEAWNRLDSEYEFGVGSHEFKVNIKKEK